MRRVTLSAKGAAAGERRPSRRLHRAIAAILGAMALTATPLIASPAAAGGARYLGSAAGALSHPVVGMAATPTGNGYWLVASDGGIFAFGDARFHGSTGTIALNRPIVGMATTPTGNGYWLVASDGGIFAFGDARFHGSVGGSALASPIVGISRTPSGGGYWTIARDGGIFAFGDARFHGSAAGQPIAGSTVAIAAPAGGGYWMATGEGVVLTASPSGGMLGDPNVAAHTPELAISQDLYERVNAERAARGLPTLSWDPVLADLASRWARQMAADARMYHQDLQGLFGTSLVADRYIALRENIYVGNGIYRDSGSSHVAFMHSDPHRADILVPELTSVGIGAACVNGTLWVTQDFGVWLGNPIPPEHPTPPLAPVARPDENGPTCP